MDCEDGRCYGVLAVRPCAFLTPKFDPSLEQEELEVPYEIKKYQRTSDMTAPPELKEVNPLGNAPVITDGSLNLAESGAIVGM